MNVTLGRLLLGLGVIFMGLGLMVGTGDDKKEET